MNCDEIEEHLADYLGSELGAEDRRRFEEHLASCPACRREAKSLGGTLESLQALPSVDPAEAGRRASVLEVRRRPAGFRGIVWRVLPYAACLIVGLSAGVFWRPAASIDTGVGAQAQKGTLPTPHAIVESIPEGIHPTWVTAARGSQAMRDAAAAPIAPSFALLAEISSRGRK